MILPAPPWIIRRGLTVEDMACQAFSGQLFPEINAQTIEFKLGVDAMGLLRPNTVKSGRFPYCVLLLRQNSSKDETNFLLVKKIKRMWVNCRAETAQIFYTA